MKNERAATIAEALKSAKDESVLQSVELADVDAAILGYAIKLTLTPGAIVKEDIELLKHFELTETAIHDIAAVTGYFAFVNRIADGLGVELERRF